MSEANQRHTSIDDTWIKRILIRLQCSVKGISICQHSKNPEGKPPGLEQVFEHCNQHSIRYPRLDYVG